MSTPSIFSRPQSSDPSANPRRSRALRFLLGLILVCFILLAVVVAGIGWYSTTPAFEKKVRGILISTLGDATGGRVELGAVRWRLLHLEFEADNLTIHGLEAPEEVPYAHLDKLLVRVKIISLLRAKVGLKYLDVEHPVVHLIVYKDGSTNQPVPKKKSTSSGSPVNTVFDLAVDRTEINNGIALFNQKSIPFSLAANDLSLGVNYVPARDHYTGTLQISDLTAQRGIAAPVHSKLKLDADVGRNSLSIPNFTFEAGSSTLAAHANLSNFNDPHWQMSAKGTVDLREAEALAAIPGVDQGVVALDLTGQGTASLFTVDGETRLAGAGYKITGVNLSGLNAVTTVHITQDELSLNNLKASLTRGGNVEGEAHLYNWLSPSAPAAPAAAALQPGTKLAATARAARQINATVAQATANPAAKSKVAQGVVKARLRGFTLPTILSIIAPPKFQNLGFATTASGTVNLTWTGNASDLAADARVALTAPTAPRNGDVPLSGVIDAQYSGKANSVLIRELQAHTPGTQLQASGGVGLAARGASSLQTLVTVSNLGEFNRALATFGVGGKSGAQALPVTLHGQARFQGVVSGNLDVPDVKGHLSINNFDVVINPGAPPAAPHLLPASAPAAPAPPNEGCTVPPAGQGRVITCSNPAGRQVPIQVAQPGPAPNTLGPLPAPVPLPATAPPASGIEAPPTVPHSIHLDSLEADAEYSPSLLNVQSAVIVRNATQIHVSGQMHAHQLSRHRLAFDDHSPLTADVAVNKAAVADLVTLTGQALPITGTLDLHAHVTGTLSNMSGGGHLTVLGGSAYGEPYKSLNSDIVFAGQEAGASNLVLVVDGGQLTGEGGFNLTSKQFHFKAQGAKFDLTKLQSLKKSPLLVGGLVDFTAQGSGTVNTPVVQATLHLVNFSLANPAGGPASKGFLNLTAHTQGGNLLLDLDGKLNNAHLQLHDETTLSGDYQSQAKLSLADLDINPYLQLYNVQGVKGHSQIAGAITVAGPLGKPRRLTGDAQLSQLALETQNAILTTTGGLHATLRNGTVVLDPLHITGGGTDLKAEGSAALFGTGRLLKVSSSGSFDVKTLKSFDPQINSAGMLTYTLTVGGTIEKPDLQGSVNFANVNAAYGDLPNGISQLNGTLVFDQGRLTVQKLTGYSGGGLLTFGGFVAYQQGIYADLSATGKDVRVRYPAGVSTLLDTRLRLQGTDANLLLSGGVTVTRFSIQPGIDASSFSSNGISPPPDPTSFANRIRLDIHVNSAPQLDINNSYAKLAGDINLNVRGSAADPSVLGHISITEGEATFAGTHYTLQHGDIYFTNPVRIVPTIDLEASAHVENYDVVIGVHGTPDKLAPTFRSEPPLTEQDIFSLLALGRTQEEQAIYSEQQTQAGVNSTADSLLGGALNATVSSRINKLFGGGSVKIDPTFVSGTGNSTARITVQQQVSKNGTVEYATNVNSTAQQLIQGQYNLTPDVSILAVRDESGVFSLILKLHRRYR